MSVRFARGLLALALVVPVVCAIGPATAGFTVPEPSATTLNGSYALVDVTDPTVTLTTPPDGGGNLPPCPDGHR